MNNPFLSNRKFQLVYCSIWIVFAAIQMLILFIQTHLTLPVAVVDSFVSNGLYMMMFLILWYPVRYYSNGFNYLLFIAFHLLLFILCLIISVGGTKLFLSAFFPHSWYPDIFLDLLPVRILIDALIYAIVVMSYYLLQSVQEIDKQSDVLAETLHTQSMPEEIWTRITVKKHKKIHLIPVKDILYVEANGDYVLIYTASGHFLKDSTMKYMETHLPPDLFVRIHRSFIINIECMTKLELYEKDLYQLHLQDNTILKVSSAGYKLLKQKLK